MSESNLINEKSPILSRSQSTPSYSTKNSQDQNETDEHWITGALILFNSSIGIGILVFPMVIDYLGGLLYGTIVQILILTLMMPTIYALVRFSEINGLNTYHEVVAVMCGKWAEKVIAVTLVAINFGISITHLILIGDQFDRIFLTFFGPEFCQHWYMNRKFTITLVTVLSIWPMTYFKRIHFLEHLIGIGNFSSYTWSIFIHRYPFFCQAPFQWSILCSWWFLNFSKLIARIFS